MTAWQEGVQYEKVHGVYRIIQDQEIDSPFLAYHDDDYFSINELGILRLKKGYVSDAATWAIDTDTFMRGAFWHDLTYQLMRDGLIPHDPDHWAHTRKLADQMLIKICKEDGMSWVRRKYVYWMLRVFGGSNARCKHG